MFCPQCGSTQSDELKFCKSCGANLQALRQVMAKRDSDDDDWGRNWFAEMFMNEEEAVKQQLKLDRLRGRTPEVKRRREIKAGVITASVGLGLMIFLFVLMGGIVASGRVTDSAAAILMRLWIVGVIPLFIGAALVINGMFVSKRGEELPAYEGRDADTNELEQPTASSFLSPASTNELESGIPFSVTDRTTRHLQKEPVERKR